jgi:HlyD family secretion protein
VIRVPATALFRQGDRWAVFAVQDGRAKTTPVEIGASDGAWTAITSGLAENAIVIAQPSDAIQDGTRVSASSRAASHAMAGM